MDNWPDVHLEVVRKCTYLISWPNSHLNPNRWIEPGTGSLGSQSESQFEPKFSGLSQRDYTVAFSYRFQYTAVLLPTLRDIMLRLQYTAPPIWGTY